MRITDGNIKKVLEISENWKVVELKRNDKTLMKFAVKLDSDIETVILLEAVDSENAEIKHPVKKNILWKGVMKWKR